MLGKWAVASTLVALTAACVPGKQPVTVSLDEAREIALELEESEFEAPPRSIAYLGISGDLDVHNLPDVTCSADLDLTAAEVRESAESLARNVATDFDPTVLRRRAGSSFVDRSLEQALIYAEVYLDRAYAKSHKGEASAKLAIYNANRGDLDAAQDYLARSER